MTKILKCDLCGKEVDKFVGQMALGALKDKPVYLDICPECRQRIMDAFGLEPVVKGEENIDQGAAQ